MSEDTQFYYCPDHPEVLGGGVNIRTSTALVLECVCIILEISEKYKNKNISEHEKHIYEVLADFEEKYKTVEDLKKADNFLIAEMLILECFLRKTELDEWTVDFLSEVAKEDDMLKDYCSNIIKAVDKNSSTISFT